MIKDNQLKLPLQQEYLALVGKLVKAQAPYYAGRPIMSDSEYDAVYRRIQNIERDHPEWTVDWSPTRRVCETPAKEFQAARHTTPMLSLDNVYTVEDLAKEMKAVADSLMADSINPTQIGWTIEPKVDGCSLEIIYKKGHLHKAITRGDGHTGEDVTLNARTIRNLPLRLHKPDPAIPGQMVPVDADLVVRGEVVIFTKDFEWINLERRGKGIKELANPRNAATGALKALDPAEASNRQLRFIAYSLVSMDPATAAFVNGSEVWHNLHLEALSYLGFTTVLYFWSNSIEEVIGRHLLEMEKWRKEEAPYWTDGTVIKLNNHAQRKLVGEATKAPRWAWAAKLQATKVQTRVKGITFQVGKTGTVCPVAELEPVQITGSTVSRATLHHAKMLDTMRICIGDLVTIQKAGEIIPEVLEVHPEARIPGQPYTAIQRPANCPCCGGPLTWEKNQDGSDSPYLNCSNFECPDQVRERLQHWCSKKAMDIEGGGPALIGALVDKLKITSVADLYELEPSDIAKAGVGPKVAGNFYAAVQASRTRGLQHVLFGLCIPWVGEGTAKRLANHFPDIESLQKASVEDIAKVEDIGEGTARSITTWLTQPSSRMVISGLWNARVDLGSKRLARTSNALEGKSFVITGTLDYGEREAVQGLIEMHGGKASSGVSKKTTYLIFGKEAGKSKAEKAAKLGVKVISEQEFFAMLPKT